MKRSCTSFLRKCLPMFAAVAAAASTPELAAAETGSDNAKAAAPAGPVNANDVAKTFTVQDGFEMQLIASEPLVADPVAIAYDENGLAYVAEMTGYPDEDKATGRIKMLEDTDGDGKFDKSYIFADGLSSPAGLACWKGGVYVAAATNVWYFKDTDGDHKADEKRKVFTGFGKAGSINNLAWNVDNKIYGSGALNGSEIQMVGKTNAAVKITNDGFRFDPATEIIEAASGSLGFANTSDDWGNRFVCSSRNPLQFVALETWYLARNKYLHPIKAVCDVAPDADELSVQRISPVESWREGSPRTRTSRYADPVVREVFGAFSGVTFYRGDAYPDAYRGCAFSGDLRNNLVQRFTLQTNGFVYKAAPADEKTAFLASTDGWFRPVNFVNAPDGTLHVVDMYREVIDMPAVVPGSVRSKINFQNGNDRGRIYRVAPKNFKVRNAPQLGKASTADLVASLEKPSGWWRDTAQRLLIEKQDKAAVEPLRTMLKTSKVEVARLHALWTLAGFNALSDDDLLGALADPAPNLRVHALKIGEPRMAKSAPVLERMVSLASTEDRPVLLQASLTLANNDSRPIGRALSSMAKRDPTDVWLRGAMLSSSPEMCIRFGTWMLREEEFGGTEEAQPWIREIAFTVGAQFYKENLYELISNYEMIHYCQCHVRGSFFRGMGDGFLAAGKNFRNSFPTNSIGTRNCNWALTYANDVAPVGAESLKNRAEGLSFLAYEDFDKATNMLVQILDGSHPDNVKVLAIQTLGRFKEPEATKMILSRCNGFSAEPRESAMAVLLARKDRIQALLDAVELGAVNPASISRYAKARLFSSNDSAIRDRATKVLGPAPSAARGEVVEKYKAALSLKGNAENGARIFHNQCIACHAMADKGADIGPKIDAVRQWNEEKIIASILDPNGEVASRFISCDLQLADGSQVRGLITSDYPTGLTVSSPELPGQTLFRRDIAKVSSQGASLMPEDYEADIQPQDMADLVAYLTGKN